MNRLEELLKAGQSVWLDNIHRGMFASGELKKMVAEGLRGMTSNPTIFEKAISSGKEYDEPLRKLLPLKKTVEEIFDALSIEDVQLAADAFRPVYDQSKGADGYVSIEVLPRFARDTAATIAEARRLAKTVGRPNVMVKIPATEEGIPAIQQCLTDGININITLIFAVDRYRAVIDAYRKALEARAKAAQSPRLASVASFFVSRIDSAVDKLLQEKIQAAKDAKDKDLCLEILGKTGIANAKVAYELFEKSFNAPWFKNLEALGARVQRPLWASTGTKNPHYSDVLYVDGLIGPQTVNTLPPATLKAFIDHGQVKPALTENVAEAHQTLEKLKAAGIDLRKVTDQLEEDGVKLFSDSYNTLMAGLRAKKEQLEPAGFRR